VAGKPARTGQPVFIYSTSGLKRRWPETHDEAGQTWLTKRMKRILIVEDKATSRELLRTVLEQQGYAVDEASDGEEALRKIRAQPPDLVLLDLQIPARNGYDVVREVRKDPRLQSVPVVAVTASAMQGDREKVLAAGFTAYIAKPVSLVQLRHEVNQILGPETG
jgi:two-component system cell cycle response regulator DivK